MFYISTKKRKRYQLLLCLRFLWASPYSCHFEKTIHLFEFSKYVYHKREAIVFPLSLYKWISLFLFWDKQCLINALNSDCACLIANKYKKIHRVLLMFASIHHTSEENWCDFQKCYSHLHLQIHLSVYESLILNISIAVKFPIGVLFRWVHFIKL